MKITENINLGGTIFTIDDDALLKLQNYLNSIERYFGAKEEREEILTDIEARIAELFQTQLGKSKEVVTLIEIDKMIEIMGMPEDFVTFGTNREDQHSGINYGQSPKLYRDIENKIIGGVCSGLGQYFKADPVIIRVLFVILTFFAAGGLLVYFVLWIILPPAVSLAEKMHMKGYWLNK
jgi:phage shock protein PspC (stress-responsive transcriptional regulator)